ncbi:MAG: hypothetical protein ACE5JO_00395 [Candidatus Binatia bacterium]
MAEQSTPSPLIGFLVVEKTTTGDGYVAALMVTDDRGYPLEFRATTPIRPTLVQRTLYGGQLEHYVGVELCGKTLVRQSSRKPKILLVPKRRLLDIANHVGVSMVAVRRAGEALQIEETEIAITRGTIEAVGSALQSVVYEGRFKYKDSEKDIVAFLQDCAGRFDLVEAFERMRAALQLLAKEDSRYT